MISFQPWIEENLPEGYQRKPMFGGFGYYVDERLILTIFESPGDRTYKNITCDFDIWDGCMFPAEKDKHEQIKKLFPILVNHPVLPKWLYLPQQTEHFEEIVERILGQVVLRTDLFGTFPKPKKKKTKIRENPVQLGRHLKPSMFSDDDEVTAAFVKAKNISDLKNLGPKSELTFKKAGIKSAAQFRKLGWKKALEKLVQADRRNCHSLFAYAMIGALQNEDWHQISAEDKAAANEFTSQIRQKLKAKAKVKGKK